MLKLLEYIKKHIAAFLLIVILLFSQAQAELALPGYMSNIISFGIQNNGITSPIPDAISISELDKVKLFLTEDEIMEVENSYSLTSKTQASKSDLDKFPALNDEDLYIYNKQNQNNEVLADGFLFSMAIITSVDNDIIPVESVAELPAGVNFYQAFEMMPDSARLEAISKLRESTDQIGDQMLQGVAFKFIQDEYVDLGVNMEKLQSSYILEVGMKMLGVTLISVAAAFLVGFLASRMAAKIANNIRSDVFTKILNLNAAEYSDFSTASLITRTTNDIQQIQQFIVMFMRIVIYAPIMAIGAVLKVLQSNANMTWIIALTAIFIVLMMLGSFALIVPRFSVIQKLVDKLNLVTRESLSGLMVIRGFNTQDYQLEKFDKVNKDVAKNHLFIGNAFAVIRPLLDIILNATILLIIWVSAKQIDLGLMRIGDMTAFIQYAMQIIMSFIMISMMAVMIPRATVAINRVFEILEKEIEIKNPSTPKTLKDTSKAEIVFDNVSFRYPSAEADVISNLSFTAKPGSTTAFIGSTGSGKSTILNLLPRFFDVSGGSIKINDIDIRDLDLKELRDEIAFVPQSANLFTGSIASNLQMGQKDASEDQMRHALQIAQAEDFVYNRTDEVYANVSQGGVNLSGGQKQRLSIARALMKEANILIFDDTFSALDFKTDSLIREDLRKYTKAQEATVLIVGQRVSSIMDSDQIIVLDQGIACGAGSHQHLMQTCPVYQEIANSQLTEEEVENVQR
ncbi:MAG TPA: ABC transporter ATP-binding protein [Erysipelotrichaceae bacterium]|nr:ABC transporter ATP-binding protein [Erysipelotrichaceae bacterium]